MHTTPLIELGAFLGNLLQKIREVASALDQQQRTLYENLYSRTPDMVAGFSVRELIPLHTRVLSGFALSVEVYELMSLDMLVGTERTVRFSIEPPLPAPLVWQPVRKVIPFLRPCSPRPPGTEPRV